MTTRGDRVIEIVLSRIFLDILKLPFFCPIGVDKTERFGTMAGELKTALYILTDLRTFMDRYLSKQKISRRYLIKCSGGFIGVSSLTVLLGNCSKSYTELKMSEKALSEKALDYLRKWNSGDQIVSISPIFRNIIETLVNEPHMNPIGNIEDFDTAKFLCTLKDRTQVKMFTNPKGVDHLFLADSQGRMIFGSYPLNFLLPLMDCNKELNEAINLIAEQKPEINLYNPGERYINLPVHKMTIPEGFDRYRAMELGNLVRITYNDYDNSKKKALYLKEGDTILTRKAEMIVNPITQYWINSSENSNETDFYKYKVIKILKAKEADKKNHNFGFILEQESEQTNEKTYFVVLRGTISPFEWLKDAKFKLVPPCFEIKGQDNDRVKISEGFNDIYKSKADGDDLSINDTIQNFLNKLAKEDGGQKKKIYVTGHSLGAALATLSTLHIAENNFSPTLYAFASPRVGNLKFAQRFSEKVVYAQAFRIANCEDLVNGLPTGTITELTGPEMKKEKDPNDFLTGIIEMLPILKSIFSKDAYEHVGQPVYFSHKTGAISSNHNMSVTYCGAI